MNVEENEKFISFIDGFNNGITICNNERSSSWL